MPDYSMITAEPIINSCVCWYNAAQAAFNNYCSYILLSPAIHTTSCLYAAKIIEKAVRNFKNN